MLFTCILVVIAVNIDSLAIGAAYGLSEIKISLWAKLGISLSAALAFFCTVLLGSRLESFCRNLPWDWLSAILLLIFGVVLIISVLCSEDQVLKSPEKADSNADKIISAKESVILGIALSVDSLGVGFSLGLVGANLIAAPVSVFIVNLIFLSVGEKSGQKILKTQSRFFNKSKIWLKKLSSYIPGIVLIALAIWQMLKYIYFN